MRQVKQLIYGVFYIALWAAVVSGVYFWTRPAASCFDNVRNQDEAGVDCGGRCARVCIPADILLPEVVGEPLLIPIAAPTGTVRASLVAEVRNRNAGFGASDLAYTFQVFDRSGVVVASFPGDTFIYPGEIKYLVAPNIVLPATTTPAYARVVLGQPQWSPEERFPRPKLAILNVSGVAENDNLKAQGVLANQDSVTFPKVQLVTLFRNTAGVIVGVSATELLQLGPGASREFSIFHPILPGVALDRTQVLVTAFNPR